MKIELSLSGKNRQNLADCLNPRAIDERTIAERKWAVPIRASKPQQPCDHSMFGDEKDQLDLCEMFADPTND